MTETQKNFLNKVKNTVFKVGGEAPIDAAVLKLARSQNLYHLMGIRDEEYHKNLMHFFKTEEATSRIAQLFENARIPFVALKGAVIRTLYPEAWMRTSCDVDVLVKEENLERAKDTLKTAGGYVADATGGHDVQVKIFDVTLELHFSLDYGGDKILENAWNYAKPKENRTYEHVFSDGFFYYFLISHMKKHFLCGATGVRAILDLMFVPRDHTLTNASAIEKFATMSEKLADRWFGSEGTESDTRDENLDLFGDMILRGGTIANTRQRSEISRVRKGSGATLKSRLFLPYVDLAQKYPTLKKHKWLLPFYEIKRIFDMIRAGRLKAKVKEFEYITKNDGEKDAKIERLLDSLGI